MTTTAEQGSPGGAEGGKEHPPAKCVMQVIYDGRTKGIEANPKAAVQALLEHAIKEFGITDRPHVMALWTEGGVELSLTSSLEDQRVSCGATLLLRPSAVRGGAW
jgi:hypothetical protein